MSIFNWDPVRFDHSQYVASTEEFSEKPEATIYSQEPSLRSHSDMNTQVSLDAISVAYTEMAANTNYCPVYVEKTTKGNLFTAYISGTIQDVNHYVDLIDTLFTATPDDTFAIYIDSPGGMVSSGSILSSAIHHSKATVYTIARGFCASAACLIHNAAHRGNATVSPMGILMIHMSSHNDMGLSTFIRDRAANQVNYVRRNLLDHAVKLGIMTQEELEKIEGGDEIYIDQQEFQRRTGASHGDEPEQPVYKLEGNKENGE